jgi:hypothetical protein
VANLLLYCGYIVAKSAQKEQLLTAENEVLKRHLDRSGVDMDATFAAEIEVWGCDWPHSAGDSH